MINTEPSMEDRPGACLGDSANGQREFGESSLRSRSDEVVARIQHALNVYTKKEAERVLNVVIDCIDGTSVNNLALDGFTIKPNGFANLSVRHKPEVPRKTPFRGAVKLLPEKRKVHLIAWVCSGHSKIID